MSSHHCIILMVCLFCHCWIQYKLIRHRHFYAGLCDRDQCQTGFYIKTVSIHICDISWTRNLCFQMWTLQSTRLQEIPDKQLMLQAVEINFVHCHSSYSGSHYISAEQGLCTSFLWTLLTTL